MNSFFKTCGIVYDPLIDFCYVANNYTDSYRRTLVCLIVLIIDFAEDADVIQLVTSKIRVISPTLPACESWLHQW